MYRRLVSGVTSHLTFFFACSIAVLAFNLTPLIIHVRNAPPGRTFSMIHNNAQDFFFYQALMNQGANGAWLTSDPFTTEAHRPSIIFAYFLWWGKLANLLSIPYPIMYHTVRILFGSLTLLAAYCLLRTYFPYPRLSFFFFVFAAGLLRPYNAGKEIITVPFMHWWTGMDPIRRAAYLPHHMVGAFLLVVSMLLFIRYYTAFSKRSMVLAMCFLPILAFIHTPSVFIILLVLPAAVLLFALKTYCVKRYTLVWSNGTLRLRIHPYRVPWRALRHPALFSLLYWFFAALWLYCMVLQTNQGFPWSQYIEWEKRLQFPLLQELPGALGILFPLALLGIPMALLRGGFASILAVCWLVIPFLFIPFSPKLGISNIRLVQGVPYLPLAILAAMGITTLCQIMHRLLNIIVKDSKQEARNSNVILRPQPKNPDRFQNTYGILRLLSVAQDDKRFRISDFGFRIFLLGLFVYFTYPALRWSLKDQIREYMPIYGNVYFDNRMRQAFSFIDTQYAADTHVLSTFYTGNYLPAFTRTTSFVGHSGYTQNVDQKEQLAQAFFHQQLSTDDAKRLLEEYAIAIVFQGPEEKPLFPGKLYPDLLDVIYDQEPVTLYRPKEYTK